jgi:hypothetical protein
MGVVMKGIMVELWDGGGWGGNVAEIMSIVAEI